MNQIEFYQAKLEFEIDSWDLSDAINSGQDVVIVDARSKEAFDAEHLPGAISFPHQTMTSETTALLDRAKLYVTYCDGIGCNASTKGALRLATLGFAVKELLGGLDWWRRDGYETYGANARPGKTTRCACRHITGRCSGRPALRPPRSKWSVQLERREKNRWIFSAGKD